MPNKAQGLLVDTSVCQRCKCHLSIVHAIENVVIMTKIDHVLVDFYRLSDLF